MAEYLSQQSITTTITGGYVYITIPDAGSGTGFTGYRITITALQAFLQGQITNNTNGVATLNSRVDVVEAITSRTQFIDEVSNFDFVQPANSIINRIRLRSTGVATFSISGSVSGAIDSDNLSDGVLYDLDQIIDSVPGQTITFTITGTVSAEIYYNKSTI